MKKLLTLLTALILLFSITACTVTENNSSDPASSEPEPSYINFSPALSENVLKYGRDFYKISKPNVDNDRYVYADGYYYYAHVNDKNERVIYKYDISEGTMETIVNIGKNYSVIPTFVIIDDLIYFVRRGPERDTICKVRTDGSDYSELDTQLFGGNNGIYCKYTKMLKNGDYIYLEVDIEDYTDSDYNEEGYTDMPEKYTAIYRLSLVTGEYELIHKDTGATGLYFYKSDTLAYFSEKEQRWYFYNIVTGEKTENYSYRGIIYENTENGLMVEINDGTATVKNLNGETLYSVNRLGEIVSIDDRYLYMNYTYGYGTATGSDIIIFDYVENKTVGKMHIPDYLEVPKIYIVTDCGVIDTNCLSSPNNFKFYEFKVVAN